MGEAGGDAAAAQPGRSAVPAGSLARSALPRLASFCMRSKGYELVPAETKKTPG